MGYYRSIKSLTEFRQNILLFDNREIFKHFFSLFRFLSVLIFETHKYQTNRSSIIARLIEYDRSIIERSFLFD